VVLLGGLGGRRVDPGGSGVGQGDGDWVERDGRRRGAAPGRRGRRRGRGRQQMLPADSVLDRLLRLLDAQPEHGHFWAQPQTAMVEHEAVLEVAQMVQRFRLLEHPCRQIWVNFTSVKAAG